MPAQQTTINIRDSQVARVTLTIMTAGLILFHQASGQILPPASRATSIKLIQGPELELCKSNEAIIRWISSNPGGTDEHFGVVNYGRTPEHLDQRAKSHIRLNQTHRETVFRVRLMDLHPGTTYFYRVDSMEANGRLDGVKSPLLHFETPQRAPN